MPSKDRFALWNSTRFTISSEEILNANCTFEAYQIENCLQSPSERTQLGSFKSYTVTRESNFFF